MSTYDPCTGIRYISYTFRGLFLYKSKVKYENVYVLHLLFPSWISKFWATLG